MSSNALRVAVAEDEPYNRKRLVRLLEEAGCEVVAAFEDGSSVQAWLEEQPEVDALFLDIRMPGASGLEVAEGSTSALPIVFVTAFSDHAVEAFDLEAADYLLKPVRAERLVRCLDRIRAMKAHGQAPILTPATSKKIMRYAAKAG
ncbi:MAG: response regulator [Holophagaceae bacterium]|nr:response regulator [Holophagaceae bacterium]